MRRAGEHGRLLGFASAVIEETLGDGAMALFVQGCGGDINPVRYKEVNRPADAEPLGNLLGLSVLRAVRKITRSADGKLAVNDEVMALPRAADLGSGSTALQAEQTRLVQSLKGTSLNFKTFLPLLIQQTTVAGVPVVLLPAIPAREGPGPRRPAQARRREPRQVEAYIAEHPDHGAADPVANEPGPAQEAPANRTSAAEATPLDVGDVWVCASETSCW